MSNKKLLGVQEIPVGSKLKLNSADHSSKPAAYKFVVVNSDSGDDQGQLVSISSQKIIRAEDIVDGAVGADALAVTAVTAGSYGSSTAVPTFTVDVDGRLTAAGTASISTSLTIQSDDASDNVVALASDKLKLLGGTGITSSNTADDVTFALDDTAVTAAAYGSATAVPSFTVDAQGRLTAAADVAILHDSLSGFVANEHIDHSGVSIVAGSGLTGGGDITASRTLNVIGGDGITANADDIAVDLDGSGIVSGLAVGSGGLKVVDLGVTNAMLAGSITDSKLSTISTANKVGLAALDIDGGTDIGAALVDADLLIVDDGAGGTNRKMAASRLATYARGKVSAVDAGGDGSFSYNSSTGAFTYTGPSAAEVRAHHSAGTGVAISSGAISIGQAVATSSNVQFANITASGNLTVNGTTTTIDTTNMAVQDSLVELGSGTSGTPANDAGFVVERGDSANAFMGWDESTDKFKMGTGTFTGASTGNLDITKGTLLADLEGDVTGNADTATALATGRTIAMTGDVAWTSASFDGSGNVTGAATIQANAVEQSMLADDAVGAAELAADAVVNASVAANAAITLNKLASATEAQIIVHNASGVPVAVGLSGDATIAASGALTLAANSVSQVQLDDDAVGADELADNAVVNASVVNGALKADKLDIDGSTDIGAALADADLFIVDDGAGGTNRKSELSRLKTYLASASNNGLKVDGSSFFVAPSDFTSATPDLTVDDMALNDVPVTTSLSSPLNSSAGAAFNYVILPASSISNIDENGYIDWADSNSATYSAPRQIVAKLDDGSRTVIVYQGNAISVSGGPFDPTSTGSFGHNHTSKYFHFWNDGSSSGDSSDGSFQLGSASIQAPPGSGGTDWSSAFFRIPSSSALSITAASHALQNKNGSGGSQNGDVMALDKSGLSATIMNGRNAASGWSLNSDTSIFGASDSLLWLEDSGNMFGSGSSDQLVGSSPAREFFVGTKSVTPGTGVPRKASLASMLLAAAGDGLEQDSSSKALKVKVDDSSIAIASDTVGVKAAGIGLSHHAPAAVGGSNLPTGMQYVWNNESSAWSYARPSVMVEFDVTYANTGDATLDGRVSSGDNAGTSSQATWVDQMTANGEIRIRLHDNGLYGAQAQSSPYFMAQVFVETSSGVKELAGTNMQIDSTASGECYASFDLDGAIADGASHKVFIGFVQMGGLVSS